MELIGDEVCQVLHDGGVEIDGVVVDRYVILLKSGRCIELAEHGVVEGNALGLTPDRRFDWMIGLLIESIEFPDLCPTAALRLSNGRLVFNGSPVPYYWGLEDSEA